MNYFFALLIPLLFIFSFGFALYKKVHIYDSFTTGMKEAVPLVVSIFPYVAAVSILCTLMEKSGLESRLIALLSPLLSRVGVPPELTPLLFVKPLSGSGAIAVLSDILGAYGVDSFIGRCACVVYGSSDTIFYIGAVYFASLKRKKLPLALLIAVISFLSSVILCCFLCQFM